MPSGTDGLAGVTLIETNPAAVTDRFVPPEMAPEVAWMDVDPIPAEVARPAVLIVATFVADELQVTVAVKFCVLLFE